MKKFVGILVVVAVASSAASQSQASEAVIDERARSYFESLLSGVLRGYSTGELNDFVWAHRTKRINVNSVSIDCDGLAMAIEVLRPDDVHFTYSLTMPFAVKLATGGQDEFMADCEVPDCVKTKLSVISPNGLPVREGTASFLQLLTGVDKGSRATREFRVIRKSCGIQD
jgi:hypothetical protein